MVARRGAAAAFHANSSAGDSTCGLTQRARRASAAQRPRTPACGGARGRGRRSGHRRRGRRRAVTPMDDVCRAVGVPDDGRSGSRRVGRPPLGPASARAAPPACRARNRARHRHGRRRSRRASRHRPHEHRVQALSQRVGALRRRRRRWTLEPVGAGRDAAARRGVRGTRPARSLAGCACAARPRQRGIPRARNSRAIGRPVRRSGRGLPRRPRLPAVSRLRRPRPDQQPGRRHALRAGHRRGGDRLPASECRRLARRPRGRRQSWVSLVPAGSKVRGTAGRGRLAVAPGAAARRRRQRHLGDRRAPERRRPDVRDAFGGGVSRVGALVRRRVRLRRPHGAHVLRRRRADQVRPHGRIARLRARSFLSGRRGLRVPPAPRPHGAATGRRKRFEWLHSR